MRISTKGRFAVNALIDLALRQAGSDKGPVALATISARQQVSLSYLEQLFSRLRRDGIVESTRGPGGGYTLKRSTEQITVADVVQSVEDPADTAQIAADGLSQALWQRLNVKLSEHMAAITLQSLVDEVVEAGIPVEGAAPAAATVRPSGLRPRPLSAGKPVRRLPPNSVFDFGRSFAR
ncbi:MAG TPA: Rrf2 family transcriptional regulator [Rubrivivax sp.]|jgi:Rrf2 family iron-sulfur cluster assembly transcriptional regulator|nr:Rrf2 family transcriptional regulator [Rubrivivax sp.]